MPDDGEAPSDSGTGSTESGLADFFGFEEHGTDMKTELVAGLTTFLTMSYIVVVNPAILSAAISIEGYSDGQVFQMLAIATIIAGVVGTLVMAFYANRPFGLAPGMGLNAYFAFTVVLGLGIPWETALAAVFVEGIIFMAMSAVGARKYIIEFFPEPVKFAIGSGIGLFLLILGFTEIELIVADQATLVTLGDIAAQPITLVALAGLALTLILYARGITGSIILGILGTAALGYVLEFAGIVGAINPGLGADPFYNIAPLFGAFIEGFQNVEPLSFIVVMFTFFVVDFFDTAGTLIGVSQMGGFLDEDGNLPHMERPLMADAVGTTVAGIIGTSTVTTFVESSTGVEEGGSTGMTALVVAALFLVSLVAVPLVAAIPTYASYLGLIVVGLVMLRGISDLRLQDADWLIPGGMTIVVMPLTVSIADGIAAGLITYPIVKSAMGEFDQVKIAQWLLAALFVFYFYVTTAGVIGG
jgi:AGZA family xanthine/uracil permease-like MFS transporter